MKPDKRDLSVGRALAWNFSTCVKAKGCALYGHGECGGPIDAHHMVRKQIIRQRKNLFDDYTRYMVATWDPRNGLPLCRLHHEAITNRITKLPVWAIPEAAWEFAHQYGLTDNLRLEIE